MKIVIDIPEDWIMMTNNMSDTEIANFLYAICINGTPLPKGHGRLIDAELLLNEISDLSTEPMADLRLRLRNAPTIIEADKGE